MSICLSACKEFQGTLLCHLFGYGCYQVFHIRCMRFWIFFTLGMYKLPKDEHVPHPNILPTFKLHFSKMERIFTPRVFVLGLVLATSTPPFVYNNGNFLWCAHATTITHDLVVREPQFENHNPNHFASCSHYYSQLCEHMLALTHLIHGGLVSVFSYTTPHAPSWLVPDILIPKRLRLWCLNLYTSAKSTDPCWDISVQRRPSDSAALSRVESTPLCTNWLPLKELEQWWQRLWMQILVWVVSRESSIAQNWKVPNSSRSKSPILNRKLSPSLAKMCRRANCGSMP